MMIFNAVWAICVFLILLWLIGRFKFFSHRRVHPVLFQIIFIIKVAAGIVMTLIYSNFYTDRSTADIFKYFDDSRIMVSALTDGHSDDFFKMVSGVDSRNPELDVYYSKMNSWDERESLYNDSRIVIRLNALLHAVSFGNYYIHMIVICFLSTFGRPACFSYLHSN